jgi:hypothetical protein
VTPRKVRQARNRMLANRIILAVLVVAVLAALYGLVGITRPVELTSAGAAPPSAPLDVTSALFGCPAPGSAGVTGGAVAIANLPGQAGAGHEVLTRFDQGSASTVLGASPRTDQLTVQPVQAAPAIPKRLTVTTTMAGGEVPTGSARGGLVIQATGANAQGLDVEQLGPGGQPTARCTSAGSDFWFLGPGSPSMHIELYLMNTDSEPADASVSIQTDSGPELGPQDSGIVVPPHSMVVQTLDKLLHSAKAIALHVTTSTGRVVAAVRESTSAAKEGDWLPIAQEPATTQILAGLPANPGQRDLYLSVPGGSAALVKVTVISSHGTYQPTGGNGINLLGHLTTSVSLPSLDGQSGSIEVTSNVPVVATLELSGGPRGAPGTFIVGSGPVVGQGVIAASPAGKIGTTELVFSAPGAAASVSVAQAVPGAALTGLNGQVVHIPARSSVELKVVLPKKAAKVPLIAIVVTPLPDSGPVYGGRIAIIRELVQTVMPVVSSPDRIQLGPVHQSLLSVLGSLVQSPPGKR